jgi:hypothetical protein
VIARFAVRHFVCVAAVLSKCLARTTTTITTIFSSSFSFFFSSSSSSSSCLPKLISDSDPPSHTELEAELRRRPRQAVDDDDADDDDKDSNGGDHGFALGRKVRRRRSMRKTRQQADCVCRECQCQSPLRSHCALCHYVRLLVAFLVLILFLSARVMSCSLSH